MMKFSLLVLSIVMLSPLFASPVMAAQSTSVCVPVDPIVGCGDANIDFDLNSLKEFATTSDPMSVISLTGCCDCEGVTKAASGMFDGVRQNFTMAILGLKHFKHDMDTSANEITTDIDQASKIDSGLTNADVNVAASNQYKSSVAGVLASSKSSPSLCRFGSLSKSIAADDTRRRQTQILLSEIGLARANGKDNSISADGEDGDDAARVELFKTEFCRGDDDGNALAGLCKTKVSAANPNPRKRLYPNADVNFADTLQLKQTLDVNLVDKSLKHKDSTLANKLTFAEQNIIAMSRNLYGNEPVAPRYSEPELKTPDGQAVYMNFRSKLAMRSMAQNSFWAMVADRATGTGSAAPHMKGLLTEIMGPDVDVNNLIGSKPSYYQQMELLTKGFYRTPDFYKNLMAGNTNVERQGVFMGAVSVMQDRDIYRSSLRTELLLANLIELNTRAKAKQLADSLSQ